MFLRILLSLLELILRRRLTIGSVLRQSGSAQLLLQSLDAVFSHVRKKGISLSIRGQLLLFLQPLLQLPVRTLRIQW